MVDTKRHCKAFNKILQHVPDDKICVSFAHGDEKNEDELILGTFFRQFCVKDGTKFFNIHYPFLIVARSKK